VRCAPQHAGEGVTGCARARPLQDNRPSAKRVIGCMPPPALQSTHAAQQDMPGRASSLRAPLVALPPAVLGQAPGRLEAHRRLEAVHVQRPVRVARARVDLGLGGVHRLRSAGRPAQPTAPPAPRALALPPATATAGLARRAGCCANRAIHARLPATLARSAQSNRLWRQQREQ